MAQKKVLKMKPKTKLIVRIIMVVLILLIVVFGYYYHVINKLEKVGYSRIASNNILKNFKLEYALNNPNNKTLNRAFESSDYKEKYLDYYKQIKYQDHDNLIKNINSLIEKKYSARDISIILSHGSDKSVTEFSKREKVKYLEEFYSYDFAKLDNYDRYVKYMNDEGDDEETTIILVNLDLDKKDYEDPVKVTDKTKTVLANKHHYLGKDYIPNNLISVPEKYTIDGDLSTKGTKEAVDAAITMIKAAEKDGLKLFVNSGYRSYDDQKEVYNTYLSLYGQSYVDKYVVNPGYSEHQTGYAFDFASGTSNIFRNSKEYDWMIKNSYKYGFCYRYLKSKESITGIRNEAWHFRYVGKEIAKVMDKEELSFEEYYAIYIDK
ncbi:MAG: M15 family metallopeptidase [Bacilli bacterium]|nr:M15 family metallopeptidase [Bacilli bacterium]